MGFQPTMLPFTLLMGAEVLFDLVLIGSALYIHIIPKISCPGLGSI